MPPFSIVNLCTANIRLDMTYSFTGTSQGKLVCFSQCIHNC